MSFRVRVLLAVLILENGEGRDRVGAAAPSLTGVRPRRVTIASFPFFASSFATC